MAQTLFSMERKKGKILIFIETVDTNKKINILNSLYSSSEKVCFFFLVKKKSISLSGIVGFSSHTLFERPDRMGLRKLSSVLMFHSYLVVYRV